MDMGCDEILKGSKYDAATDSTEIAVRGRSDVITDYNIRIKRHPATFLKAEVYVHQIIYPPKLSRTMYICTLNIT